MDANEIAERIYTISPKPGDVIIMRTDRLSPMEYSGLVEKLKLNGFGDNLVLALTDDSDVYTLDEDDMRKFGWVRA